MKTIFYLFVVIIIFFWLVGSLSKCGGNNYQPKPVTELTEKEKQELKLKTELEEKERIKREVEQRKQEEKEEKAFLKTKAGRIYKKHPEWSKEDCQLLADNRIWIGMTYQMLKYKRGLPNHANPSNYGNGTQWQWCWDDYTPSCFYDNDEDGIIDSYN